MKKISLPVSFCVLLFTLFFYLTPGAVIAENQQQCTSLTGKSYTHVPNQNSNAIIVIRKMDPNTTIEVNGNRVFTYTVSASSKDKIYVDGECQISIFN
jgi:hypothetical protein